jgi:hypothetical protein
MIMVYTFVIISVLLVATVIVTGIKVNNKLKKFRADIKSGDVVEVYLGGQFVVRTVQGLSQMSVGKNGKNVSVKGIRVLDGTERKTVVVELGKVFPPIG